jgi:hypothetical protein
MSIRTAYPGAEIVEISPPGFADERADQRGTAVPLLGQADPGKGPLGNATPGIIGYR